MTLIHGSEARTVRYRCWRGHFIYRDSVRPVFDPPSLTCACGARAVRAPEDKPLHPAQVAGCCYAGNHEECERPPCPCNPSFHREADA